MQGASHDLPAAHAAAVCRSHSRMPLPMPIATPPTLPCCRRPCTLPHRAPARLQSGNFPLLPGLSHRFCIWAAICSCGADAQTAVPTAITMVNATSYLPVGSPVDFTLTSSWQRLCFYVPPLAGPAGNFYFTLRLGAAVEQYCIDDASVEWLGSCVTWPPEE